LEDALTSDEPLTTIHNHKYKVLLHFRPLNYLYIGRNRGRF